MSKATRETPLEALRRNVSGKVAARVQVLNIFERNQLKVARSTMHLHCIGAAIMGGGLNHNQAAKVIHQLTGAFVNIDADCTCMERR